MNEFVKSIHPFPARMASSIVWERLPDRNPKLRILDPMSGSGTTLVVARMKGHSVYGVDRDPLARIISRAWCSDLDKELLEDKTQKILCRAQVTFKSLLSNNAYPRIADEKTKEFIRYWFDLKNRKQLTALSKHISLVRDEGLKTLLWTAFSRTIITKKIGASLAWDVSHSRPHKVYEKAPKTAFELFPKAVSYVAKNSPFNTLPSNSPKARISDGDSRRLPFKKDYFDWVITSPPYLNAIDYLRGHKLALVWMGYTIGEIRKIRRDNIGAEVTHALLEKEHIKIALDLSCDVCNLGKRERGFLTRYIIDMDSVCSEVRRVLKPNGKVVFVIGNSTIKGVFIENSNAIRYLSEHHNLVVDSIEDRPLPENRRYLPPPSKRSSGKKLQARMRNEVILSMTKKS